MFSNICIFLFNYLFSIVFLTVLIQEHLQTWRAYLVLLLNIGVVCMPRQIEAKALLVLHPTRTSRVTPGLQFDEKSSIVFFFSSIPCKDIHHHSIVEAVRDLWRSSGPPSCPKQDQLQQGHVQSSFEYSQAGRFHSLPGQPAPGTYHPHGEKFPLLQLMLAFLLSLVRASEKSLALSSVLPSIRQPKRSQILWESSVPEAEHTQLLQPFPHCSSLWPSWLHSSALTPVMAMSFLCREAQNWTQHSRSCLTNARWRGLISFIDLLAMLLLKWLNICC